MSAGEPTPLDLERQNERLSRRLKELEEVLAAMHEERIDAVVVDGPQGKRVFTLESVDRPYRAMVEEMHQGALTLDDSGTILYCNRRFAWMVGLRPEKLLATQLERWIIPSDRALAATLVRQARAVPVRAELQLATAGGAQLPVYLSLERLSAEAGSVLAGLVTDLSDQYAHRELVASEELARSIVDQAVDAMVVCDPLGTIVRCNQAARDLCSGSPLRERFESVFPLSPLGVQRARAAFDEVLGGARRHEVDVEFVWADGTQVDAVLKVGPLTGARGQVIGAVAMLSDISERVRSERERARLFESERAARAEAERANRLKDEFVATLSHELRTPLNAILGWVQLLRASAVLEGDVSRGMEVIERNARLQAQLISDLLDMSRMLSGGLRLERRSVDLQQVVAAAIETVLPAAQAKQLELQGRTEAGLKVLGDPARLEQVVWNLLTNAIKFTPPLGHVSVALRRADPWIELEVQDDGQGIRPDFLPHVFDRFRQADGGTTRASAGLGLGLAIVKQLVELHAGIVRASSEGDGQGARFTIRLPAEEYVRASAEEGDGGPAPAEPAEGEPIELAGISVLLVEDDADARELARLYLAERGARVKSAASVDEALQVLRWFQADVLVSDIGLPGRDGYELLSELRRSGSPARANLRAVALTAFALREDEERARRAGYQAHLAKPIDLGRLAATIRSVLEAPAPPRAAQGVVLEEHDSGSRTQE